MCVVEGCNKEAARSPQLCWKHDYLKRYWTNARFREKRKATKRAYGRRHLQEIRDCIAKSLGGWKCADCGVSDRDVLSFDHVDGRGEAERNRMGGQLPTIRYYHTHLGEARRKLQVLCANCNWKKNSVDKRTTGTSRGATYQRKERGRLIELLGGPICASCGETDQSVLTIDHITGGGTADRKRRGGYWRLIHSYLSNPQEASKSLRILCRNCNWKSHRARAGVKFLA